MVDTATAKLLNAMVAVEEHLRGNSHGRSTERNLG